MSDIASNPYHQPPPDLVFSAEEPPKGRGCFFYGCLIAVILAVLGMILTAVLVYLGFQWTDRTIKEYTSTSPVVLPEVKLPEEEKKAVEERWATFRKALEDGKAAELSLNADEVNTLIDSSPDLRGKFYVSIKGDKVSTKMSLPIDFLPFGLGKGRFLNGSATITVSLRDGDLIVHAREFEVNGKSPPPEFMQSLSNENLAKNATNDPANREKINRLKSIVVKDGRIVLKSRAKDEPVSETESDEKTDPDPDSDAAKAKKSADSSDANDMPAPKKPDAPAAPEPEPEPEAPDAKKAAA